MNHVVIVHGFKGKPNTNWKPWLKKALEDEGFKVDVPEMPATMAPVAQEWQNTLALTIGTPTPKTYLIGHSLGSITILRYLETLNKNQKIGGCILVAGFGEKFPEYAGGHDTFFDHELNWERIRQHCNKFIAIHSDNDTNVGYAQLSLFATKLKAKTILMHSMGHFGSDDGVFELPVVKNELLNMAQK
jgi:uncharacterized protein